MQNEGIKVFQMDELAALGNGQVPKWLMHWRIEMKTIYLSGPMTGLPQL
jgi:hypothetical protein